MFYSTYNSIAYQYLQALMKIHNTENCREKSLLWIGICRNGKITGSIFTNGNINGAKYLYMLHQEIIPQLNIWCGNIFNRYRWAQDGAGYHRTLIFGNLPNPHNYFGPWYRMASPTSWFDTMWLYVYGVIWKTKWMQYLQSM